ncbi:MAG TPA: excinuclease ABC subunit UvrA [Dehalococcoidia bacterium]|nr:excinuclease ABC subunit UvrA [Dehalococcoidia bacterium]
MPLDAIIVKGAREHNLKDVDVEIPRDKLVVITGLSGSGKSSLAFDTIYAEGQRRYVESLSAYARQFLGQMEKPDVDYIEGLSPAISIDQKGASRNPRSTVGTVTEIYDYLRLLYARAGTPHCPTCGRPIERQTVQQIVDAIIATPPGKKLMILAPIIRDRKGEHLHVFEDARRAGFVRVRVDGRIRDLAEDIDLDKKKKHTVEVVVDRLITEGGGGEGTASSASRLADSVEQALKLGGGTVLVDVEGEGERLYSEHYACAFDGTNVGELAPRNFSFNSPHGACAECTGLGVKMELDEALVIPNRDISIEDGAIAPWSRAQATSTWYFRMLQALAKKHGFKLNVPVKAMKPRDLKLVLYGDEDQISISYQTSGGHTNRWDTTFEGVIPNLSRRYRETDSDYIRAEIEKYMSANPCPACKGSRLKPETLAVTVAGKSIVQVTRMDVREARDWTEELAGTRTPLNAREQMIAKQILKEIRARLTFMFDVGLDYLSLDRAAGTLSGGEAQRIRLATQIGSSLMGVLYVCDEPSIGLHPVDDERLIRTLERLRDLGNTVLIVEHDESMMRAADHIIDMGPGAGEGGGRVVAEGPIAAIMACEESMTGAYLSGRRQVPLPESRRPGTGNFIKVEGARENNLKNIDVQIPLGMFVCVTGVSGSGKSTLINDLLYKKAAQDLYNARERPGKVSAVRGLNYIDKVVDIDQSPIGRTPRSNPATYTGLFTPVRELFASTPEARLRGYTAGRFSFNVKGGRCEACAGDGYIEIEMHFLPDVTVPCEVCKGKRYNREALEITYKGKNISDVLDMTVSEALAYFENIPSVRRKLETLHDVGLGYIRLGQPATTVSGGEAQRVKLSTELSKRSTGKTLYILDEPTTGLSFEDTRALLVVLQRLVDAGNTVVVIEHHMDVVKNADWIIDLGPLGGDRGGEIVAQGTPEQVALVEASYTGLYLRKVLPAQRVAAEKRAAKRNGASSNGAKAAKVSPVERIAAARNGKPTGRSVAAAKAKRPATRTAAKRKPVKAR